jgi:urease accessory protein
MIMRVITPTVTITTTVITTMSKPPATAGLLKLMTWLSPTFPVGSFSYSHGLEAASAAGLASDVASLEEWVAALVSHGSGWKDAVLFAEAWRRGKAGADPGELAQLGEALAGSLERHAETTLQGAAFLAAARNGWPHAVLELLPASCPYPVAVGAMAGAHGLPLEASLAAFLQAFSTNLAQAAIRLGVTGQKGAVETIARLENMVTGTASRAAGSTLDDLGAATILSEVMAMRHETQYSRLFRT